MSEKQICRLCKYWVKISGCEKDETDLGQCRVNPPVPGNMPFAIIDAHCWCGEFKHAYRLCLKCLKKYHWTDHHSDCWKDNPSRGKE